MPTELTRAALLAYRDRRWDLVRESKHHHWAAQTNARGPTAGLEAGAALWHHAREVDPAWPTTKERDEDLEHHIALAAKLMRLEHVLAGR